MTYKCKFFTYMYFGIFFVNIRRFDCTSSSLDHVVILFCHWKQSVKLRNNDTKQTQGKRELVRWALRVNTYARVGTQHSEAQTSPCTTRYQCFGTPTTTATTDWVTIHSGPVRKTLRAYGINTFHEPATKLRSILVHPKDCTPDERKFGVIDRINCDQSPEHTYIGELKTTLTIAKPPPTQYHYPTHLSTLANLTGQNAESRRQSTSMSENPLWPGTSCLTSITVRFLSAPSSKQDHYVIKTAVETSYVQKHIPK